MSHAYHKNKFGSEPITASLPRKMFAREQGASRATLYQETGDESK